MTERLTDAEREALERLWRKLEREHVEPEDNVDWLVAVVSRALAAVPRLASSADAAPGAERRGDSWAALAGDALSTIDAMVAGGARRPIDHNRLWLRYRALLIVSPAPAPTDGREP